MRSHLVEILCLDHVVSFSSCKEIHAFFSNHVKKLQTQHSEAPEPLLDLGTPCC